MLSWSIQFERFVMLRPPCVASRLDEIDVTIGALPVDAEVNLAHGTEGALSLHIHAAHVPNHGGVRQGTGHRLLTRDVNLLAPARQQAIVVGL